MNDSKKPNSQRENQKGKGDRFVFVDQARALALTMMLVGHSLHQFLAEPWRSSNAYQEYQFYRGITSALFLMVSGFSFVVASFKYWDDYTRLSPRLLARLRRIGYVLFFAYFLQLYGSTLARMVGWYSPGRIEYFLRFDVLQNIGFSLLLLHATAFFIKKMAHFWKATLVLLLGIVFLAVFTYDPSIDAMLPVWLAPALNTYHRSMFPMVPFTGFMLMGAFFAYWFWIARQKGTDHKVMGVFIITGIALIAFEQLLRHEITGEVFPYASPLPKTPGNTFARCGSAMLVIGGFYFLEKVVRLFPKVSLLMSKDSLAIYVVHLPIVYGSYLGIGKLYRHSMSPWQVLGFVAVLMTGMLLMAWAISNVRKRWPQQQTRVRRTLLLAWWLQFLFWVSYSVISVSVSLGLAIAFMAGGHRRIADFLQQAMPGCRKKGRSKEPEAEHSSSR